MKDKTLKSKAISIKGKKYVQVKDRIGYFNEEYPNGSIETKYQITDNELFIVKAIVYPDVQETPDRFFNGLSQAKFESTGANQTAPLENAETSAVGRALAMMGIGVLDSIASTDEMNKAGAFSSGSSSKPSSKPGQATPKQMNYINSLIAQTGELPDKYFKRKKINPERVTAQKASDLIEELKGEGEQKKMETANLSEGDDLNS